MAENGRKFTQGIKATDMDLMIKKKMQTLQQEIMIMEQEFMMEELGGGYLLTL